MYSSTWEVCGCTFVTFYWCVRLSKMYACFEMCTRYGREYESSCAAVLREDGCALRQAISLEEVANSLPITIVISGIS